MPIVTVTPPPAFTDFVTSALGTDFGHVFDSKTASVSGAGGRSSGVAGDLTTLHLENSDSNNEPTLTQRLNSAIPVSTKGETLYSPLPEFNPSTETDQIYTLRGDGSVDVNLGALARYLIKSTPKMRPADILQADYQTAISRLSGSSSANAAALLANIGFDNVTQMAGPVAIAISNALHPAPSGIIFLNTILPALQLSLQGNTIKVTLVFDVSRIGINESGANVELETPMLKDALRIHFNIDTQHLPDILAWNGEAITFDSMEVNAAEGFEPAKFNAVANSFPVLFWEIEQLLSAQLTSLGITKAQSMDSDSWALATEIAEFTGNIQAALIYPSDKVIANDLPSMIEGLNSILIRTAQTNPALSVTLARAFTETINAFERSGILKDTLWENPTQPISEIAPYFTRSTSPLSVEAKAAFNNLDLLRPDYLGTPVHLNPAQSSIVALAFGLGLAGQAAQKQLETAATDRTLGATGEQATELTKLVAVEAPRGDYRIVVTGQKNIIEAARFLNDIPREVAGSVIWQVNDDILSLNYKALAANYSEIAPRFLENMREFTGLAVAKTAEVVFGQGYASQIRPRAIVADRPVTLAAQDSDAIILNIGETVSVTFPRLNYTSSLVRSPEQRPVLSIQMLSNEAKQTSTTSRSSAFPVLTKQEALFSGVEITTYGDDVVFDANAFVWGEILSAVRQVYSLSQPTSVDFLDEAGDRVVDRIGSMETADELVTYLTENIRAKGNRYFDNADSSTATQLREVLGLLNALKAAQSLFERDRNTYSHALTEIEPFLDKTIDPASRFFVALNNLMKGASEQNVNVKGFSELLANARAGGAKQLMSVLLFLGENRNNITLTMRHLFEAVVYNLPDLWVRTEPLLEKLQSKDLIEPYVVADIDAFLDGTASGQTTSDVMDMINNYVQVYGHGTLPDAAGAPFFNFLSQFVNSVPADDPLYAFVSHIKSQDRSQLSNSLYALSLVARFLPPNAIPHFKDLVAASRGLLSINNNVEPANADMLKGELRALEAALINAVGSEDPSPALLKAVTSISKWADKIAVDIGKEQQSQRDLTLLELKAEYKSQPGAEVKVFQLSVPHAVRVLESNMKPVVDLVEAKNKYDGIPVLIRKDVKTGARTIEFLQVGDSTVYLLGDKMPDSLKPSRGRINAFLDAIVTPRVDKTAEATDRANDAVKELKRDVWYQASVSAGFQPKEAPKPTGHSINKRLSSLLAFVFTSEEFIMFEEILSLFL